MRTYICATTKMSEKPGLAWGTTFSFTIPDDFTSRSDIKRPMRSIMLRECEDKPSQRRARSPHGGIRFPSFGSWKAFSLRPQKGLESTTSEGGYFQYFSLTEDAGKERTMRLTSSTKKTV